MHQGAALAVPVRNGLRLLEGPVRVVRIGLVLPEEPVLRRLDEPEPEDVDLVRLGLRNEQGGCHQVIMSQNWSRQLKNGLMALPVLFLSTWDTR